MKSVPRPLTCLGEISTKLTQGRPLPSVLAHKSLCPKIRQSDLSYAALVENGLQSIQSGVWGDEELLTIISAWLVLSLISGLNPYIQLYQK